MRWSITIGELFGISIRLHAVFLLLLVFIGWSNASVGGLAAGILSVLFLLLVFFFVLLHELGHSLAAMRYGVKVRDIILLPIGGVARMERLPKKPAQEIIIALAGPAVNFLAVLIIAALLKAVDHPIAPRLDFSGREVANSLVGINLVMGLFNLIPAFPMDGGRILRGLLALRFRFVDATRYASRVGQGFAALFFAEGMFGCLGVTGYGGPNFWLVLIAVLIFLGAGGENQMVRLQQTLDDVPVTRVMSRQIFVLHPDDLARKALQQSYQNLQDDFPVTEDGRLVGMLSKDKIVEAISQQGTEVPIKTLMEVRFLAVRPETKLPIVYEQMTAQGIRAVPVVEGSRLMGMLTLENIGRYFAVAEKFDEEPTSSAG